MKSYSQVYNQSKKTVLETRKKMLEEQKISVLNVLKEEYMITGKVSSLPKDKQEMLAKKLCEYWSPKTGLNQDGVRLLTENTVVLTKKSTLDDVKRFIVKRTKRNIVNIVECFRTGMSDAVVESFNDEFKQTLGKKIQREFIVNTIWEVIQPRLKKSL